MAEYKSSKMGWKNYLTFWTQVISLDFGLNFFLGLKPNLDCTAIRNINAC
jgi:hypothetical protein